MLSDLIILKNLRYVEIDERTSLILDYGFYFGDNTPQDRFTHKISDNLNYADIMLMRDCLSYPQPINTAVLGVSYNLVDANAVIAFSTARCHYKQAVRATGKALKLLIQACTTIAEVDLIIDTRPLEYVAP